MSDVRATLAQAREQRARADFQNAERSLLLALDASVQIYQDPGLVAESLQMLTAFYTQAHRLDEAMAQATWALAVLQARAAQAAALAPVYDTLAQLAQASGQREESDRYRALAAESRR